ncbi:hypothetical protein LMG19083_04695 [Ralstonia psammae]|uniref:Transglycosylase SLT domain-containing protein n=1 Tax=Ralstonia psammae TaxID=3058598 RepID=A0ABM9JZF0_9RALS|nr:transglycosylase SLT domain-containing protein [Ralstonia sp. LMG 19083]CAJ0808367.1 hypothetical protein LMG19083_04695 [Ralstonia sp. LMG 19083]
MWDFIQLAQQCAPTVDRYTMAAVVRVESSFNPWAIGVVKGRLARQPRSLPEAIATAQALEAQGYRYSVGLAQIERSNLVRYGLTLENAFDPCTNLAVGSQILTHCFERAKRREPDTQIALRGAISCYYSGQPNESSAPNYVRKVADAAAQARVTPIPVVPEIAPRSERPPVPARPEVHEGNVTPPGRAANAPAPSTSPATQSPSPNATNDAHVF